MKYTSRFVVTTIVASFVSLASQNAALAFMVDDFEQDNSNPNTLGFWSAMSVNTDTSAGGFVADAGGAQKNGTRGGVLFYSNGVTENARCTFYTVLRDPAPYLDLSTNTWYLRFWVKANGGTPAIDAVRLEDESSLTKFAELDFASFNAGTHTVAGYWKEISIPVSNFLAAAQGGFTLASVKTLSLAMKSGSSTDRFSSVYIDDLQFTNQPAPPAGLVVTNSVVVDDFEQNNAKPNTLGFWSDVYVDTLSSTAGFIPDTPGAQQSGNAGGVVYYSNGVAEVTACRFYTVLREDWPYMDLTATHLYVRFWIRLGEGTPAIDQVILEGTDPSQYGRVSFAGCNGGAEAVRADWHEISIHVTNFLADTAGGFSLSRVKVLALTFPSASSVGRVSAFHLDQIQFATNAAPPPVTGQPVTSALMIDDFEQNNANPNTRGLWSDVYVGNPTSVGGLVPDLAGVQKNGSRGGVLYYTNGIPESAPCKFYSVIEDTWPYLDLTVTSLYLRFWIKAHEGTPAIDKVILEGNDYTQYGRVNFAAYNGGRSYVAGDWNEISIPVDDFLADSAGGFTLTRAGLLAFTFVSTSSPHRTSSFLVDDLQLSPEPAPVPTPEATVYYWLTVDDFEQNNGKNNSLGHWSDLSFDPAQSFGGFMPDFGAVQHDGLRGGVLFYSNSPSATVPCFFYSVLSETWPHVDMSRTQMVVSFWIKGGDGAPAVDKIVLQGDSDVLRGQVDFADYNGGSSQVAPEWRLVTVPVTGFLAGASGGFSGARVKLFGLEFCPTSSVGLFSSVWIDQLRVGKADEDLDGMPDEWEDQYFGGHTNGLAWEDDDHDGASNLDEFLADTHPGDTNSVFFIEDLNVQSPPALSFHSSAQRLYNVLYVSNLLSGAWVNLTTNLAGNGDLLQVVDPDEAVNHRFYRVGVRLP